MLNTLMKELKKSFLTLVVLYHFNLNANFVIVQHFIYQF